MLPYGRMNGRLRGARSPLAGVPNPAYPQGNPIFPGGGNQMIPQQGNPLAPEANAQHNNPISPGAANQVNAQQNNNANSQPGVMGPLRRKPLSPLTGIVWVPPGAKIVDPSEVPASAQLPWGATPIFKQRSGPRGLGRISSSCYMPAPRLVPYDGRPGWNRRGAHDLLGLVVDGVDMMWEEKEYMWWTICSNNKCRYGDQMLYISTDYYRPKKCKKCKKGFADRGYIIDMDPETR